MADTLIGRVLGRYQIVAEIGRGGMGVVYRALDTRLGREVAIKVLPPDLVTDPDRRHRFIREAQTASRIEHPHVGVIHEVDETDGVTFMAMELILTTVLMQLERVPEAKAAYHEALNRKIDLPDYHERLFGIAVLEHDSAAMAQQLDWAKVNNESDHQYWLSQTALLAGQGRQARALSIQAVTTAERANLKDVAAGYAAVQAATDAAFGDCEHAKQGAGKSVTLLKRGWQYVIAASVLARCGDIGPAESLGLDDGKRPIPDTFEHGLQRPWFRALVALHRNEPAKALDLLTSASARKHERGWNFWVPYLRGEIDLALGKAGDAAAEFQMILDHPSWDPLSWFYPLAHVGAARAAVLGHDIPKAKKEFAAFFALWKDADADTPILIAARKEHEAIK